MIRIPCLLGLTLQSIQSKTVGETATLGLGQYSNLVREKKNVPEITGDVLCQEIKRKRKTCSHNSLQGQASKN